MGRGKLEAWQTSGMANQRNRRLIKSWQTRGAANLVIENAGKLEGVANQWHACPPNSCIDSTLDVGDRIQFSKIERIFLVFCEVVKYLIVCLV